MNRLLHSIITHFRFIGDRIACWLRPKSIVVVGRPVADLIVPARQFDYLESDVLFEANGTPYRISCDPDRQQKDKCNVLDHRQILPLIALAVRRLPGGGAVNSIIAAAALNRQVRGGFAFTLVSETAVSDELRAILAEKGVDHAVPLGDTAPAQNVVLVEAGNAERYILRDPTKNPLSDDWRMRCNDALQHRGLAAMLINSCKSMNLAMAIGEKARSAGVPLFVVLSKSTPEEFRMKKLLPLAAVGICNLAEYSGLCEFLSIACPDIEAHMLPEDLILPVRLFAAQTKCRADLFITLGAKGFVHWHAHTGTLTHVCFTPAVRASINAVLSGEPTLKNGSGDAFAGYLVVSWMGARDKLSITPNGLNAGRQAMLYMAQRFGIAQATAADVIVHRIGSGVAVNQSISFAEPMPHLA